MGENLRSRDFGPLDWFDAHPEFGLARAGSGLAASSGRWIKVTEEPAACGPSARTRQPGQRWVQSLHPLLMKNLSDFLIVTTAWPEVLSLAMIDPSSSPPVDRSQ